MDGVLQNVIKLLIGMEWERVTMMLEHGAAR